MDHFIFFMSVRSITNGCRFLVGFVVDARGGAMRGLRHSGVRIIVPPSRTCEPTRVTCKLVRAEKVDNAPPLCEGEALASRILKMGPIGAKFTGFDILQWIFLLTCSIIIFWNCSICCVEC